MQIESIERSVLEQCCHIAPGRDPFWDMAEENLMKSVSHYINRQMPEEQRNITGVHSLLSEKSWETKLDAFFTSVDGSCEAKLAYESYKNTNQSIKNGIIAGVIRWIQKNLPNTE
ncbi:MAG: hypothetical protein C4542_05470 [Dehalococcoidia bacterium]|nr:MAG: hypothetical protein C4542_05470 [Dehalococcoidia bacterium]